MGFWDVRLADLEAVGEVFTEDEVRVLEEGGKVLHLHPLETPDVETYDWCIRDDGEVVLLPEVCNIIGPLDYLPPPWRNYDGYVNVQAARYLDDNFGGWRSDRSTWTFAPHYAGDVDTQHDLHGIRCEEFGAFVYWNCHPLVTAHDVLLAEQIVNAGTTMLDKALWWPVEWICQEWYSGDGPDPADHWLYQHHRDRMEPEDRDEYRERMRYDHGDDWGNQSAMLAANFDDLLKARIVSLYGDYTDLDPHAGEDNAGMVFPRLEDVLDEKGQHDAADLVRRMLARRRAALTRHPSPANYRGYTENEVTD